MTFAELEDLFDHPPQDFSPTPLWWWSGGKVTRERIRWQLERFLAGGVYNLVIINLAPAGPIVGARADNPAWFSEEWWDRFVDTCQIADELGLRIWFYDQIGFSGANVQGSITHLHPEAAGLGLRLREAVVNAGRLTPVGNEQPLAAYSMPGPGQPSEWASRRLVLDCDGLVDAADGTQLSLVSAVPTAFDYLSSTAVALLIDKIHSEYDRRVPQYLGNVIAGSFQDELPATNSWTTAFAAEFLARKGYDLLDHLPALWQRAEGHASKVRGDYYSVRAELTEEALFRPLGEWHSSRGMLIGADQSSPARAGYPNQSTQLYTDYFRTHRWYNAAGSDHEGDAKVHSSMAHLYDHERVWIESFHSSGWGGTLEDTYDWLVPFLRSGANLYNPHASYFDTSGGWFEWAPPSTDWRQPYWHHYPQFARAVARMSSIMSWGDYCADVAVLFPSAVSQAVVTLDAPLDHFGDGELGEGFAAADHSQQDYLSLSGSNNWFHTRPGLLDQAGISFDVIDDPSVQRAVATAGALQLGNLRYATVLLPSTSVLETATAARLIDLLDCGGQVIVVGDAPQLAAGTGGDDAVVASLADHPQVTFAADPAGGVAAISTVDYARSDVPVLVRRSGSEAVALVSGAFPNASSYPLRTNTWRWTDYDFDPSRYAALRTLTVAAPVDRAEVWNPATGHKDPATVQRDGAQSLIEVPLDGAPAVIVVWHEADLADLADVEVVAEVHPDPAGVREPVGVHEHGRVLADLSDGWTGELVPTMDNAYGDLALPAGSAVDRLQIWSLDWSQAGEDAEAEWTPVKVTNGQQVAVHPPVPARQAPPALGPDDTAALISGRAALGGDGWEIHSYSNSRGRAKDSGLLGNKGMVPEEFVQLAAPALGEIAVVRALVQTDRPGAADLVVAAGGPKGVWWNGVEAEVGDGYLATVPVEAAEINVLEVRLGPSDNARGFHVLDSAVGCFFALSAPAGFGTRPQLMTVGDGVTADGHVLYRQEFETPSQATSAQLVVGAATGLTIAIDGRNVARQEKVEYYETPAAAEPMFFSHDVTGLLGPGPHEVRIVANSADSQDVVFVDLVIRHRDGLTTVVSGPGWRTESGGATGESREHRGHWSELAPAHAAARSHPLPETEWLHGPPSVGQPVDRIKATVSADPRRQAFRARLPAGTTRVELPIRLHVDVTVDGHRVDVDDGGITLDPALQQPAELMVITEPTRFDRGGAAWLGPIVVDVTQAPIRLDSWREIGLRSWSGGVRYRRPLDAPTGAGPLVLDLGRVRGSVDVELAGVLVGSAFCAPYRFQLPSTEGGVELVVTVYNTLGPFFDESTPTTWVFPSQLESGLFGPVLLHDGAETRRPDHARLTSSGPRSVVPGRGLSRAPHSNSGPLEGKDDRELI